MNESAEWAVWGDWAEERRARGFEESATAGTPEVVAAVLDSRAKVQPARWMASPARCLVLRIWLLRSHCSSWMLACAIDFH